MGRNDAGDMFMVALAYLAFDLALPTEVSGPTALAAPEREEKWVRKLFEKAVLGFAQIELEPLRWTVRGSTPLYWQVSSTSDGVAAILPRMVTDIILEPPDAERRLVVDTKFTSILGVGRFGGLGLKSDYLLSDVRLSEIARRSRSTVGQN
jgi:5-methylcytosine-specific restriction enzyme subunit McrC